MNAPLRLTRAITMAVCIALPCVSQGADAPKPKELARGRYLVMTSGCNDCHTAGYKQKDGNVPEKDWLKGDILGWSEPPGFSDSIFASTSTSGSSSRNMFTGTSGVLPTARRAG